MFGKLRQCWRRAREVATARRIARNMAALGGPDVTHLPDDELVVEVRAMSKQLARRVRVAGQSLPDSATMADALRRMGDLFNWVDPAKDREARLQLHVNGFAAGGGGEAPCVTGALPGGYEGTLNVTFHECGHRVTLHGDGTGPLKVPDHCPRCAED